MHPFELSGGRAARLELATDPVFDRLHVVLGARLDLLDGEHIGRARVLREALRPVARARRERGERCRRRARGKREQPGAFDAHTLAHEGRLAENISRPLRVSPHSVHRGARARRWRDPWRAWTSRMPSLGDRIIESYRKLERPS